MDKVGGREGEWGEKEGERESKREIEESRQEMSLTSTSTFLRAR